MLLCGLLGVVFPLVELWLSVVVEMLVAAVVVVVVVVVGIIDVGGTESEVVLGWVFLVDVVTYYFFVIKNWQTRIDHKNIMIFTGTVSVTADKADVACASTGTCMPEPAL